MSFQLHTRDADWRAVGTHPDHAACLEFSLELRASSNEPCVINLTAYATTTNTGEPMAPDFLDSIEALADTLGEGADVLQTLTINGRRYAVFACPAEQE